MGGQHSYFGLWLDSDFGNGHSRARPRCTTYGSPQLSGDEDFKLDTVEVWAVGQPPEEQEQVRDRNVTVVNFVFLEFAFWFKKCLCWLSGWEEEERTRCRSWSTGHDGNDREDPAQPRPPRTWGGWGTVRKNKNECCATINLIQNKSFCLYNKCLCTVDIYYTVYIYMYK